MTKSDMSRKPNRSKRLRRDLELRMPPRDGPVRCCLTMARPVVQQSAAKARHWTGALSLLQQPPAAYNTGRRRSLKRCFVWFRTRVRHE